VPWRPLSIRTRLALWYTGALLGILLVIGGLSYWLLSVSILQDVDRSLLAVGNVVRNAATAASRGPAATLRDTLGTDFSDGFFQVVGPEGALREHSSPGHGKALPLSAEARANAAAGRPSFETQVIHHRRVRLLALPVFRNGSLDEIVQVGMSLKASEQSLARYLEALVVLVPLGAGLSAIGGMLMARAALHPVDEITRTARWINAEALDQRVPVRGTGDELDRLAETLNAMLAHLGRAFEELRRFSADAAHELRTPLTALKGGLEVALRMTRSPEQYRSVLQASLEDVERLIRLAEDLLLLSRSTAGLESPRLPIEIEPLLLDVLDTVGRLAKEAGVSVRLDGVEPFIVRGDAGALRRAVLNLVENGIKYTGAQGEVRLSARRQPATGIIVVEDTGPGIAPADAERVFEPFVRLDAARGRDSGGAGLGLAIARSIVVAHDGALALDPARRRGCRFTIRLPLG
jgi:two-component system OmpR family sensor kinase